jgi:hypothetical protein
VPHRMNEDIPFLTDSYLRQANQILQLPSEITVQFEQTLRLIRDSQTLCAIALECHHRLYGSSEPEEMADDLWPNRNLLTSLLGEQAGMFPAVVLISGLPKAVERYRAKGIPETILVNTMKDMELWMRQYHRAHGVWGFDNFEWLKLHMTARLFRLGRLQFILDPFRYKLHVFRHVTSGEIIALSDDGIWYNHEGLIDGNNGLIDVEGRWESRLEVTEQEIVGNPILPLGYADCNTVTLTRAEWRKVLTENDPVLHVHIPEGGKMSHELCLESYRQALDFFPRYFPDTGVKAIACGSWLLSPQFRQLLPESSNIVQFLNDYHLFPLKSKEEWTFDRVFGAPQIDPATAPRDTTLRRAILDFMAEGHRMIAAGGFILREDAQDL